MMVFVQKRTVNIMTVIGHERIRTVKEKRMPGQKNVEVSTVENEAVASKAGGGVAQGNPTSRHRPTVSPFTGGEASGVRHRG